MQIDPIWRDDTQQQLFRRLLNAFSRPGKVVNVEAGGEPARLALLAILLDDGVTLADPDELLDENTLPLLKASTAGSDRADFLLCDGAKAPTLSPKLGDLVNPDRSATLLLELAAVGSGSRRLNLTGPGVRLETELCVEGLHSGWLRQREEWVCAFPLGVDMILLDRHRAAALPRTTRVGQS